jgi:release factor glutamine methyltransferase
MGLNAPNETRIEQALSWAQASGVSRLEAQLLMLHALARPLADRSWLYLHGADPLAPDIHQHFKTFVGRRLAHEPLAYITGQKEFFGLTLAVDQRVLDPRADTETLVEWALDVLNPSRESQEHPPRVLDLGCGSGAIALAIKANFQEARVTAVDQSQDALEVAQNNARALGLDIDFRQGSWFEPLEGDLFDVVVSNPPYIEPNDPHLALLQHEPQSALVSLDEGLADIQAIVDKSPQHLHSRGWLLIEHGFEQAPRVSKMLETAGFELIQTRFDLAGLPRCTGGRLKSMK